MKAGFSPARRRIRELSRSLSAQIAPVPKCVVTLESMHHRLELLVTALYGRAIPIREARAVAPEGWLRRVLDAVLPQREREIYASSDGEYMYLPPQIAGIADIRDAQAQYRLLALQHAERVARGVSLLLPADDGTDARLTRDLYLLAEGNAIDNAIVQSAPGVRPALERARAQSLARRPRNGALTSTEQHVERMLRAVLTSDLRSGQQRAAILLPSSATPADSLAWAQETTAQLHTQRSGSQSRYRGLPCVQHWGSVAPWSDSSGHEHSAVTLTTAEVAEGSRKTTKNLPPPTSGTSSPAASQLMSQVPDRNAPPSEEVATTNSPSDIALESDAGTLELPDDSESAESTEKSGSDAPAQETNEGSASAAAAREEPEAECITYAEWDYNLDAYRPRAVTVILRSPAESDTQWAASMLAERSTFVRQIRQHFERLRAQRVRLVRQQDGDELDLAACVGALVDWRMGRAPDDRLYARVLPARQPVAIALLVDVSASTNAAAEKGATTAQHVIDVEKLSLLFASEALDALGDKYAILSFSSNGASNVRVAALKDFSEPNGEPVRRRISAIAPEGNTRLGAAIRHATALLAKQPAAHRLLLILSDGKPSDSDRYFEEYGAEDSRQAILEARTAGVFPFCLAIESDQPSAYLPRIFGPDRYIALGVPDELPDALLRMLRELLGSR